MKCHIGRLPLLAFMLALMLFAGCAEKTEFRNVMVTEVPNFYEPADNRYLVLQPVGNLYFEWERASSEDNSIVYYDLLFDRPEGDFSSPVYVVPSDNRGIGTGATLSHSTLDRIAAMMGVEPGMEGAFKWTVRSSRGLNQVVATSYRTITVVRLTSVPALQAGELLYIAGEGAEEGQQVKRLSEHIYEIYTHLEADKPYYFYSELGGNRRTFTVVKEDNTFRETYDAPEGSTVSASGEYRLKLDFETAAVTIQRVDKVEIRVSWTSAKEAFQYAGKGIWELKDYNVRLTSTDWGFDERYKIIFTVNGVEEEWGQAGTFYDPRPSIDRPGYRDMAPTESGQWAGAQFKFPNELCDPGNLSRYYTDVRISMTAERNYTHDFLNIRD